MLETKTKDDEAAGKFPAVPFESQGHCQNGGQVQEASPTAEGIAICGSHPKTVPLAPWDKNWLIYACSPDNTPGGNASHARALPRVDQWFEVHTPIADATRPYAYLRYLEQLPCVWMRDEGAMDCFPGARAYPEKLVKETFGPFTFTSSIAYMMAKAILDCEALGIKNIGLWGIMQASQNEYAYQRPGIQNMIWEANKRGIKVVAPDVSKLFEPMPDNW